MGVRYDVTPRVAADPGEVRTHFDVADLGGIIGVRVIVDDSIMPSRQEVLHAIDKAQQNLPMHEWPAPAVALETILTEDGFSLAAEDGDLFILE